MTVSSVVLRKTTATSAEDVEPADGCPLEGADCGQGKPSLHVHIVLGLADGSTRGGHLLAGTVRPTLEVMLTEVPATLRRKKRADLGIALIDLATARS
jgi:predicted DNA-binding protein with PD1-like motif